MRCCCLLEVRALLTKLPGQCCNAAGATPVQQWRRAKTLASRSCWPHPRAPWWRCACIACTLCGVRSLHQPPSACARWHLQVIKLLAHNHVHRVYCVDRDQAPLAVITCTDVLQLLMMGAA